jgi:hypothetical protein
MKKHIHYDLIIAYANGAKFQYRVSDKDEWVDCAYPSFSEEYQYQVKPETIKYRVGLFANCEYSVENEFYTISANSESDEKFFQDSNNFRRWLTDWIEVETK